MSAPRPHASRAPLSAAALALALLATACAATGGGASAAPAAKPAAKPAPATSAEKGPQFFLSWYAPWGSPGAQQLRNPACDDTTRADTLFLCLRPNVNMRSFVAFTGDLWFFAERPETLGTAWHFERGAENAGGLSARFRPDSSETGWIEPWRSAGNGGVTYARTLWSGHMRLIYAVIPQDSVPLKASLTYTLARIAVQPRHSGLSGCDQGMAIWLQRATLATDGMHEYEIMTGGSRFAGSGTRAVPALARLWHTDEQAAGWRLKRVEPAEPWPPK